MNVWLTAKTIISMVEGNGYWIISVVNIKLKSFARCHLYNNVLKFSASGTNEDWGVFLYAWCGNPLFSTKYDKHKSEFAVRAILRKHYVYARTFRISVAQFTKFPVWCKNMSLNYQSSYLPMCSPGSIELLFTRHCVRDDRKRNDIQ